LNELQEIQYKYYIYRTVSSYIYRWAVGKVGWGYREGDTLDMLLILDYTNEQHVEGSTQKAQLLEVEEGCKEKRGCLGG
jgi:hypothetical protein